MSDYVEPAATISEAWLRTLQLVHNLGGRRVNVLTTVTNPLAAEDPAVRAAIDKVLIPGMRKNNLQSVETVADTIFPHDLYNDPGISWSPNLLPQHARALDEAAGDLYANYSSMLPLLRTAAGNPRGTYFGRMISWPGKDPGGINQLADRIKYLRGEHLAGRRTYNLGDMVIGGEAEQITEPDILEDIGLQEYMATDRRPRGFPCLVHVDLTLLEGHLSMLAVYRHQYLISKAYGNLLGLARLLGFLGRQTGFTVGELAVQATLADSERNAFGGQCGITGLLEAARSPVPSS
jgi:hypothetical protein